MAYIPCLLSAGHQSSIPFSAMALAPGNLCLIVFLVFVIVFTNGMPNKCHPHESNALLVFKEALNVSSVDPFPNISSWVNGSDCCSMWDGIECDNHTNQVISVRVSIYSPSGGGVIDRSLCHLRFLQDLYLNGVTGTLPPCLPHLPYLQSLYMNHNKLSRIKISDTICLLTNLSKLDLAHNELKGIVPSCLINLPLTSLRLSYNQLRGSIPSFLVNLSSLTYLSLANNQLNGSIPSFLANLSSIKYLYLYENQFSGSIPNSLGSLPSLEILNLSANQLRGTIPSTFSHFSSITELWADRNAFNETVSSSSLPSSIISLSLTLNYHQSISETFFYTLAKLKYLRLSNCFLNISTTWIPSFQLEQLSLISCRIGGPIPPWISTQFSLYSLELVNNSLAGEVPSWMWDMSSLKNVNLSRNNLQGSLFSNNSIWMQLLVLDMSENTLTGKIPSMWSPYIRKLLLNDNFLRGKIPPSLGSLSEVNIINLANNNLTGIIPPSMANCSSLQVLNLGNNSLKGRFPHGMSKLSRLYSLVVHNNKLNGLFPSSIANCSELEVLDIGHNSFDGQIPKLIGNLSKLRVLVMRENNFTGSIPVEFGKLMDLQILLLSSNHISGFIPPTILYLQAMAKENQNGFVLSTMSSGSYYQYTQSSISYYQEGLDMTSKGRIEHYPYILSTLTSLDFSNNELEGKIPSDFGKLKGLRNLNLSMNNFNGTIPNSLGEMHQLESLDLSSNKFSGKIPDNFEFLSSLGFLNLSNNHLSGSIPQGRHIGTFGEPSYSENPDLWGCPVPRKCFWPQFTSPPPVSIIKEKRSTQIPWYEIAVGLSYGAGFGVTMSLIMIGMRWRKKYFNKVDIILKFLFPWLKNWTI